MKATTQKTITINGNRYTASKLRKLAQNGVELNSGDMAIQLPCGAEIAVREYKDDEEIAVLNWGGINRKDVAFGRIVAFLLA